MLRISWFVVLITVLSILGGLSFYPIRISNNLFHETVSGTKATFFSKPKLDVARAVGPRGIRSSTWRCYCITTNRSLGDMGPWGYILPMGPLPHLDVDAEGNILNTNESMLHLCTKEEIAMLSDGPGGPWGCIFENVCLSRNRADVSPVHHSMQFTTSTGEIELFLPNAATTSSSSSMVPPRMIRQGVHHSYGNPLYTKISGTERSPFPWSIHGRRTTEVPQGRPRRYKASRFREEFFFWDASTNVRTLFVPRIHNESRDVPTWSSPSASPKSLAVHWVSAHPFNMYHAIHDGWSALYTTLRSFAVSESIIRDMTIIDWYQPLRRPPVTAPEFINPRNMVWHLEGLYRVCYERPVLIAADNRLEEHFESRRQFRSAFIDAHLGHGAAQQQELRACHAHPPLPPKIIYISRENKQRGIANEDVMLRYLGVLHTLGAHVKHVEFTNSMPMKEQVALVAQSNILVTVHGAALIHATWLPLWCGELVELISAKKWVQLGSAFNRRAVRNYRRQRHFYWWNNNNNTHSNNTNVDFHSKQIVLDVEDFHHELRRYLLRSSYPTMHKFGWKMHSVEVHGNGTVASVRDDKTVWNDPEYGD